MLPFYQNIKSRFTHGKIQGGKIANKMCFTNRKRVLTRTEFYMSLAQYENSLDSPIRAKNIHGFWFENRLNRFLLKIFSTT